jgi:small nuclear ribonucleoprotein (snRNP)-like protein
MNFENNITQLSQNKTEKSIGHLATGFRDLSNLALEEKVKVFEDLNNNLENEGFINADVSEVARIVNNNSLICRSESFDNVMNLILDETPIKLIDKDQANMCTMSYGDGLRTAMIEGFSGRTVSGMVKVVLTFNKSHLTSSDRVPADNDIWRTKPETAKVSLIGEGYIMTDDVEMVSFRFPAHFFPEELLIEEEKERLENENIPFIIRHYIPNNKITAH